MIIYLDASALVKLYAIEDHRDLVEQAVSDSSMIASALVLYAEARAALARKEREGGLTRTQHAEAVSDLDSDMLEAYVLMPVEPEEVFEAGDLAHRHALRGYDAVHLSSAVSLRDKVLESAAEGQEGELAELERIHLLTFDKELYRAARAEGIAYELEVMEELVGPAIEGEEQDG